MSSLPACPVWVASSPNRPRMEQRVLAFWTFVGPMMPYTGIRWWPIAAIDHTTSVDLPAGAAQSSRLGARSVRYRSRSALVTWRYGAWSEIFYDAVLCGSWPRRIAGAWASSCAHSFPVCAASLAFSCWRRIPHTRPSTIPYHPPCRPRAPCC